MRFLVSEITPHPGVMSCHVMDAASVEICNPLKKKLDAKEKKRIVKHVV
jgi:hypothetical protein